MGAKSNLYIMKVVYAVNYKHEAVQKLINQGAKIRNPRYFKDDSDTSADKVYLFGDYPAIEKAYEDVEKCEYGDKAPKKPNSTSNKDELQSWLDYKGVSYSKDATNDELYELVKQES